MLIYVVLLAEAGKAYHQKLEIIKSI